MTDPTSPPDESAVTAPTGPAPSWAMLEDHIGQLRGVLAGLQEEIVAANAALASHPSVQLIEANEHLILTALQSRVAAETASQELSHLSQSAGTDVLTGLPNRATFLDRCTHAIASARRHSSGLALLFLDLDQFKHINDTLGHAVGDEVLVWVSRCLGEAVREGDTVSRHGGDEFLILLTEVGEPSHAAVVATKVLESLGVPHLFGEYILRLSASIGISLFPDHAVDAPTLIRFADHAMYAAKRSGTQRYAYYGDASLGPVGSTRLKSHHGILSNLDEARADQTHGWPCCRRRTRS